MANANIEATTKEAWARTVVDEVMLRTPLTAMFTEHNRVSISGKKIGQPVIKDTLEDNAQSYTPMEGLEGGSTTIWARPKWGWKYVQLPIEYGVEEELQNQAGGKDVAPVDIVAGLLKAGHTGMRLKLTAMMYSESETDETGADFQSIPYALDHDTTYGELTRATTVTNKWWQGASIGDVFTDRNTALAPSIANFRIMRSICQRHVPADEKFYAVMGESLFQAFQSQVEARHIYSRDGSKLAKYGFQTFVIDGVEFVQDSWLTTNSMTTDFFLLAPSTWDLRVSPKRNFKMTGFTWQGDQVGGLDKYLARILLAGNLTCSKPNANIWKSNMA